MDTNNQITIDELILTVALGLYFYETHAAKEWSVIGIVLCYLILKAAKGMADIFLSKGREDKE